MKAILALFSFLSSKSSWEKFEYSTVSLLLYIHKRKRLVVRRETGGACRSGVGGGGGASNGEEGGIRDSSLLLSLLLNCRNGEKKLYTQSGAIETPQNLSMELKRGNA